MLVAPWMGTQPNLTDVTEFIPTADIEFVYSRTDRTTFKC